MSKITYLGKVIELATKTGERPRFKVELLKEGQYLHPSAPEGKLDLGTPTLKEIHDNFKSGCRGPEIPTNKGHADPFCASSPAWIQDMEYDEAGPDGKAHLYGIGEITDDKLYQDIEAGKVKYFSPELLLDWVDPADGKTKKVMKAGAFTNMPHIKGMKSIALNFEEVSTEIDLAYSENADPKARDETLDDDLEGLSEAKDEDAMEDDLPDQCRSCRKLFDGVCPFPGIELKEAAANLGTCPQYEDRGVIRANTTSGDTGGTEATMGENPDKKDQTQISLEEFATLKDQVTKLVEANTKLESEAAKATALQEAVTKQAQTIAELSEAKATVEDQKFVDSFLKEGKISAHQANLCERMLKLDRGIEVKLSDEADAPKATVPMLLKEILDNNEVQVSFAEHGEPYEAKPRKGEDVENVKLSDEATGRAKEIAKERGGRWEQYFGEALIECGSKGVRT